MERRVRKGRDGTRYCNHHHRRYRPCMIVLVRKAGTTGTKDTVTATEKGERAIIFACELLLVPSYLLLPS